MRTLLLLALVSCGSPDASQPQQSPESPQTLSKNVTPTADLNGGDTTSLNKATWPPMFNSKPTQLTGYVVFHYVCPPCPPGAKCKPCMKNNFVFSSKPEPRQNYNGMSDQEMVVFVDDPLVFAIGSKHTLILTGIEVSGSHWKANLESTKK